MRDQPPIRLVRAAQTTFNLVQVRLGSGTEATGELLGLGEVDALTSALGDAVAGMAVSDGDVSTWLPPQPTSSRTASIVPAIFSTRRG